MLLITSISTSAEKYLTFYLGAVLLERVTEAEELHENVITGICINTIGESDFPGGRILGFGSVEPTCLECQTGIWAATWVTFHLEKECLVGKIFL